MLAKGLLLHERLDVDLVVLCHGKEMHLNPSFKLLSFMYIVS